MRKRWIAAAVALVVLLAPGVAYAQARGDDGLLLRAGGNVTLAADETVETLIVLDGNALILGTARDVIVIGGDVELTDARVDNLFVASGNATLSGSTVVAEDVRIVDGELTRGAGVSVQGSVIEGGEVGLGVAFGVISVLIYLGITVAVIVLGLAIAAVAGRQATAAGRAITEETAQVVLAAVVLVIAVPIAGVAALATVIGIPTGLMVLVMVLPAVAVIGYVVAGIRLGQIVLGRARSETASGDGAHPYLAAVVGIGLLQAVGWVPVIGFLVAAIASAAGAGGLGLLAWRAFRARPAAAAPAMVSEGVGVAT